MFRMYSIRTVGAFLSLAPRSDWLLKSLLYRCKCSISLQTSTGRCPLCICMILLAMSDSRGVGRPGVPGPRRDVSSAVAIGGSSWEPARWFGSVDTERTATNLLPPCTRCIGPGRLYASHGLCRPPAGTRICRRVSSITRFRCLSPTDIFSSIGVVLARAAPRSS